MHQNNETAADRKRIRESGEYYVWRSAVLKRDHRTCRLCGSYHRAVIAHHQKPFLHYPALRLEVDNGLTVCDRCHALIHGEMSPEQLEADAANLAWRALPVEERLAIRARL